MFGILGICFFLLFTLNTQRERQRVAVGKPAKIKDTSMTTRYETYGTEGGVGENGEHSISERSFADFASIVGFDRFQEQRVCISILKVFGHVKVKV